MSDLKFTLLFPVMSDSEITGIPSEIILGLKNGNAVGILCWLAFLQTRKNLTINIKSLSDRFNLSVKKIKDILSFLEYCRLIKIESIQGE